MTCSDGISMLPKVAIPSPPPFSFAFPVFRAFRCNRRANMASYLSYGYSKTYILWGLSLT